MKPSYHERSSRTNCQDKQLNSPEAQLASATKPDGTHTKPRFECKPYKYSITSQNCFYKIKSLVFQQIFTDNNLKVELVCYGLLGNLKQKVTSTLKLVEATLQE
jgi:hypothetical protein